MIILKPRSSLKCNPHTLKRRYAIFWVIFNTSRDSLTPICELIFKLLRKNFPIEWNIDCQFALKNINNYLLNPPMLISLEPDRPSILYLMVHSKSMGCVLGQYDKSGKNEQAIYYLSKRFIDYETRYTPLEKTYLALVNATKRLRHYFLSYKVFLISRMDPIKYFFEKLATIERMA